MTTPVTRLLIAAAFVLALAVVSLFIGVSNVSLATLVSGSEDGRDLMILLVSRIPRTLALILSGMGLAIAGMIMQMLARNRFVEPSTAGTTESAGLGMLVVLLFFPDIPLIGKMLVAAVFALAGTALFLRILREIPLRSVLLVPLVGIMLGGIISSITTFFAYRFELLQSLGNWQSGDFSTVLSGRYELLWIAAALTLVAWLAADRFTVAGMGEEFTTNLGLNHRSVMTLGLIIVSLVSATVVVTVGAVPFLGLIVPNVVSMLMGDNLRRSIPWIAVFGAGFVLACDIVGRVVRYPYEIPIGTVVGIVGSAIFLYILLRREARYG
ncbi:ABC transporter permease [Pelagibacterium flavum]|uniref:ABC transporter permease n=1 Tax=Pelagibacterium flavum TaxID=2984530 RepID=A0ABY6IN97_9HYPH|nr:ABC transporter permease [Pelagibacterium sp. YIM 151497]UYQ70740.1 ABC transporter permease [Pelagibacterium sp. YIM 151497]|tara:strand:- start:3828 stop:4802 length:975 start_codon:yes stop_codon:yes gene_type:complete